MFLKWVEGYLRKVSTFSKFAFGFQENKKQVDKARVLQMLRWGNNKPEMIFSSGNSGRSSFSLLTSVRAILSPSVLLWSGEAGLGECTVG